MSVDIQLKHKGVVIHDIAQFHNHLEIACHRPTYLRHLTAVPHLLRAFNDSYDDGSANLPDPALLWVRLNQLLRLWAYDTSLNRRNIRSTFLNIILSRIVRRINYRLIKCIF
jgi:hypothetical protein